VDRVEPVGWAALAHVALDDVLLAIDGVPAPDVGAVERLLKQARQRRAVRLVFFVRRGIHTMFLEVEPSWNPDDRKAKTDR
jgi:hypothetical protein